MRCARPFPAVAVLVVAAVLAGCLGQGPQDVQTITRGPASVAAPTFDAVRVGAGGLEPRIAVGPDGTRWVSTQDAQGNEAVFFSRDGVAWNRTAADPPAIGPCCDNEIAVTPTGRVLTSIITGVPGTTSLDIRYSDDGGRSWSQSQGNYAADQDRQWLAVGSKDPLTGEYDVYMLWHNLLSGAGDHEMFVSTSRDNGATFGPPVPITPPGSPAWLDLQCADSGGPSNIVANNRTGQVYAVFGTRSSPVGGCGASATGPFEINVVASTRIWVATSGDQGLTWTDSLAVDDSAAGNIVGMQMNAGALDRQGNIYVVYPESPRPYPDYEGAAVRYKWSPADMSRWSEPVTVEAAVGGGNQTGAGHLLVQMAAGDAGRLAFFYLSGTGNGTKALWYPTIAQTQDGLNATPSFSRERVGDVPAWRGTASGLMGVCDPLGPQPFPLSDLNAAANGLACDRSSDVFGQALGAGCDALFAWYDSTSLNKERGGTYVSSQSAGPTLCAASQTQGPG